MKKTFALLLSLSLILSLFGCSTTKEQKGDVGENKEAVAPQNDSEQKESSGEKTMTIAMMNAWDSLIPLNTNSNYSDFIVSQVFEPLVRVQSDGNYATALAESWEANEDSTVVTFTLNEKAKWHDGTPVTAEDVEFSFKHFSKPSVEAVSRYYLAVIAGTDDSGAEVSDGSIEVKALDDKKVAISMKGAMYPGTLLLNISSVSIIPKHIYGDKTVEELNNPELWTNGIGSGPFIYKEKIEGERMVFVANKDYYKGAPKITNLVVRIVPSQNLLSGLISGELDVLLGGLAIIPLDDWEMTKAQENILTQSIPSLNYQTLILNTQKPYLTKKVRQALSMSVNRQLLVDALLQGEGVPVITPIVPDSPYYNSDVEIWYNPEKAKQVLKDEGFPFEKELNFLVPSGNTTRERAAVLIQQDLQKIGVKVNIQTVDFPTLMSNMREGKHDMGIIGSGGVPDPGESHQMIAPTSPVNFSRLTSSELADLIEKGNAELTFEKRLPYFKDYQAKVKEVSAMPYLYASNMRMAHSKKAKNINASEFSVQNWMSWTWDIE